MCNPPSDSDSVVDMYEALSEDCNFSICLNEEPNDIISNAKYIII